MKTAMKKVFSLMLVAVLLVGMVPFQASANTSFGYYYVVTTDGTPVGTTALSSEGPHTIRGLVPNGYVYEDHLINDGAIVVGANDPFISDSSYAITLVVAPAPVACSHCGATGHEASAHCTLCAELNHTAADHCTQCGAYGHDVSAHCTLCAELNHTAADHCSHCGAYGHALSAHCNLCGELHESGSCVTTPPTTTPTTPAPTTCHVCGADLDADNLCSGCVAIPDQCLCLDVPTTTPENHFGEIKFTPYLLNDYGMPYSVGAVYVKKNATMGDVFAQIAIPADYSFSYWSWDIKGEERINNYERIPSTNFWNTEFVIYAQYAKNVQSTHGFDVRVNLNYEWKMGETLKNVAFGSRMGDVLRNIQNPVRWGYQFKGWYWDAECKTAVKDTDMVMTNCTIFAKWAQGYSYETMLKIYVNGDARSAAKIVDLHEYAKDGWISLDEVKTVVKKYYTAKDSNGLEFHGVYDAANWNNYTFNRWQAGANGIAVEMFGDTTVYVMVNNAKVITSATADKTNPKTGDMIMMPAAVLGLSASALAVLFYLNKKRAI